VPTANFPSNENIVSLGGNSLSALGNASQEVVNPALDLIFSTAIGNFDLTAFLQALQSVELADIQAEPTITTLDKPAGGDSRRRPCADPGHRRERRRHGADRHPGARATVSFQQTVSTSASRRM